MKGQIKKFLDRYRDEENTQQTWKSALKKYEEFADERGIDILSAGPPEIEQYLLWMKEEDYSPNTISTHYEALRQFYKSLDGFFGEIEESPFEHLDRKRYVKKSTVKHNSDSISYLTKEQIDQLCQNVPDPKLRNRLMIRLQFQTGMRQSELVNLKIENINREERSIEIFRRKTEEWGKVYYQSSLDSLLDEWLEEVDGEYLFDLSQDEPNKIIKKTAKEAEIQEVMYRDKAGKKRHKVTSHSLRHSHAIHAIKSGVNLRALQNQLSHQNLDQTMRYLQIIGDDVREEYEKFE